jgi:hypothetical protein
MRKLLFLSLLALISLPALASKRASIKQFEQGLAEAKGKPDREFARWVFGFDLNERVSGVRLARWKEAASGDEGRRALGAIADLSAFQNLPVEEIPKTETPSKDEQTRVISAAGIYVEQMLSKLPNFFAMEAVTTFEDTPAGSHGGNEPMHYSDFMRSTVRYRNGREVMETTKGIEQTETDQTVSGTAGLLSSGEFGPVLHTVLTDAQTGKLGWSHWETLGSTTMAVFQYSVPRGKSHYKVKALTSEHGSGFQTRPAYHGEIGIDPTNGMILRLTLLAEMTDDVPVSKANLMVEYGPVEIGGKSYVCPVRSVASVEVYDLTSQAGTVIGSREKASISSPGSPGGVQEILNDVIFEHYQVLRSEATVITGDIKEDQN